ncbi:MAG: glycosyltransferase family 2 protein [Pirellulales bacterium]
MIVASLLVMVGAGWLLLTAQAWRNLLAAPSLPAVGQLPTPAKMPTVSVVIAARDEAARLENTIRGLLAQGNIELQLVVVDDRSSDETPQILGNLARLDERITAVRIDELPAGWLGKCHACAQGAARATGDWLLFTDGDIHMRPDCIGRAIAVAVREQADHVTLWPAVNTIGPLARASILAWGQCLALHCPATQINRDQGTKGVGIGAFNLLKSQSYRALEGHEPLRMEVVDDVKLGLLVRRAGFRQRLYSGLGDIEAEWAQSGFGVIRAVEKNWFAGMNYNLPLTLFVLTLIAAMWLLGLLGPLLHPWAGGFALAGWLSPILPAIWQARQAGWPRRVAILAPLGYAMFVLAGVNSTFKTLRQGGVCWRGTTYPLRELRAGLVK